MSIEVERMYYESMDTPRLAAVLQAKITHKAQLVGRIAYSQLLLEESHTLRRGIRIITEILQSRQTRMKGF